MLGVTVEVTVNLLPVPERAQALLAAFDDVERAGQAVGDIIAAGIIPAGLEMMDGPAIQAAEAFAHAGYPTDAAAILICELDGTAQEVAEHIAAVRDLLLASGATEVRTAQDDAERLRFWKGRKSAFPAVGASPRTTTAWTAPSPAAPARGSAPHGGAVRANTACRWPMSSTPATATCTR